MTLLKVQYYETHKIRDKLEQTLLVYLLEIRKTQRSQGIGLLSKNPSLEGVERMPLAPLAANMQLKEHADNSKGHQKGRGITSGTTGV